MTEPATKEEYERRYMENYRVEGYGIEGVTNHFPCPFCAAPDWHVVRIIDFGVPPGEGTYHSKPIECQACGRSARYASQRTGGGVTMGMVQTAGPDPAPWVPIARDDT